MLRADLAAVSLAVSTLVALPPASSHAQEIRLGPEFQVNAFTIFTQNSAAVARSAGGFVVAWVSNNQDGQLEGVFARRFSSTGVAITGDLQVNAYTLGTQRTPAVAIDGDGDFVVVWDSFGQDGYDNGIFGRRFSSAGIVQGGEFQISAKTTGAESGAAVSAASGGDFVVVWQTDGSGLVEIAGRRYASEGTPLATELMISSYDYGVPFQPGVAMDADGDFVATWGSAPDNQSIEIFARRFSSAGSPQWPQFQVNVFTLYDQNNASVAAEGDGDFTVVWESLLQDGSYRGVFARRFSSAGAPLTFEVAVNSRTEGYQFRPSVATDQDGDFIVSWQDPNAVPGAAFARRFASTGFPQAPDFLVNTYTPSGYDPAVAMGEDGDFVLVWTSFGQDMSLFGVRGQRFSHPIVMDIDGNGAVEPLTDGLLALRYAFGFRGATLISGAVDLAGCARCAAPAIEAYLAGIVK